MSSSFYDGCHGHVSNCQATHTDPLLVGLQGVMRAAKCHSRTYETFEMTSSDSPPSSWSISRRGEFSAGRDITRWWSNRFSQIIRVFLGSDKGGFDAE